MEVTNQTGVETTGNQPTPAAVAVETQPTPQQTTRAEVYQKYYGTPEPEAVQTQPVAQPQVVQPQTPTYDPSEVQALKAEIEALRQSLPKPPEPAPAEPPKGWVDLLRAGEFDKAEEVLINRAKAATAPEAIQQAVAETLELVKIQNGVEGYLTKLRADNPDIVPMERYLRAPVEMRIEAAKQSGKIKSADDFLRVYKESVDAEISEMRKISQGYRAAGKQEAMTTQRTVLSATPLSPNGVTLNREAPSNEPQSESAADYIAKRMAQGRAMRGLAS